MRSRVAARVTLTVALILPLALGLPLAALGGCSGPATTGQQRMDRLASQLDRLASRLEASKAQILHALESHALLVANADDDLPANFRRFAGSVEDCVEDQQELARSAAQIDTDASAYLAGWEADNARIHDGELKSRGEERRETAQARLDEVRKRLAGLAEEQQPLLDLLRDHVTFLSNDLNAEAASSLAAGSGKLRESATRICNSLDQAAAELRDTARTLTIRPQG
jgi:hypothetical protein